MICQNCNASVDNDLIFCTECGSRLHQTVSNPQTVSMNDSVVTKVSETHPQNSKSNLKWVALIVALIALPVSAFIVYRMLSNSKPVQTAVNSSTLAKNAAAPAANKLNTNASAPNNLSNVNIQNNLNAVTNKEGTNEESANSNQVETVEEKGDGSRVEIWNDHIEIAPGEHLAVPFEATSDGRIVGNVNTLQGAPIDGLVYLKSEYDDHFPDPIYKFFSFGGDRNTELDGRVVKQKYVLVLMNNSKAPTIIQGKFYFVEK